MKNSRTRRSCALFSAVFALLFIAAISASAQAPDFSKVEIKTTKVTNNFYTLQGQGGTIGVLAGPDGILVVDTEFAPLTDKIVAAIKADFRFSRSASWSIPTFTGTTREATRTSASWARRSSRGLNCVTA